MYYMMELINVHNVKICHFNFTMEDCTGINLNKMKTSILLFLLIFSIGANCQTFNGDYGCFKTSYKDNDHAENNFTEETKFNIAIFIEADAKDGRIVIQDPRTPKKLLIYRVINRSEYTEIEDNWIGIYDCLTDHLENETNTTLTLYINDPEELTLMVSDDISSQMFFNLTKQ